MGAVEPAATELATRVEEFVRAAIAAAASVALVARSAEAIAAAVAEATRGCRSIVIAEAEIMDPTLLSGLHSLPGVISNPSDEQLATADVGITEAFAGVASTGSVCIALGASLTPAASLLMPLHVVLLPAERILNRPRDLMDAAGHEPVTRNFVFTTGPSATADMGPLVRGVHGPHRLHIVVVEH
jgi:L-lactate dehydrogenase complex protein LldG